MVRFFFDVFDGARAVRDEVGDLFADVADAADLAAGLLADFAREAAPAGLSQDYRVVVRDGDGRAVYQAVLSFRAAFLDGRAPVDPPDRGLEAVPGGPRPRRGARRAGLGGATRPAGRGGVRPPLAAHPCGP